MAKESPAATTGATRAEAAASDCASTCARPARHRRARGPARPRLKIHAGAPVRGYCRLQRFLYTRGDIDIFPAGVSDVWEEQRSEHLPLSAALSVAPASRRRGHGPRSRPGRPRAAPPVPGPADRAHRLGARRRAQGRLSRRPALHREPGPGPGGPPPRPLPGAPPAEARPVEAAAAARDGYIEEHLDQDLSLARLADVAGVSASHLKTLFRRSTGLPVHEYVVQRRVERARNCSRGGSSPPVRWRSKRASRTRATWRGGCDVSSA